MQLRWCYLVVGIVCGLTPRQALGAPPEVRSISPAVAQRGVEARLQVLGQNFAPGIQPLLPFAAEARIDHSSREQAFLVVKPAPDIVPGIYPVRVRTAAGLSNLLLLAITDLPLAKEVEPNGRVPQAQPVVWPCLIAGSIGGAGAPHPSKDVDLYRFSVKKGQRLTLVAETRRLGLTADLLMRLRDATGRELADSDDVPGLGVDPRLDYTFPEAGDYIVEFHLTHFDYQGRNFNYLVKIGSFDYARSVFPLGGRRGEKVRLHVTGRDGQVSPLETKVPAEPWSDDWLQHLPEHVGSLPWRLAIGDLPEITEDTVGRIGNPSVRDGTDFQSVLQKVTPPPQKIDWPATVNGKIAKPGEVDRFRLQVKPGQKLRASVDASYLGSALNGVLRAHDATGKLLGESYQRRNRMEVDPLLDFVVPDNAHEVTVSLEDCFGRGGIEYAYRLTLEAGGPDFELTLGEDFPRDGNAQNDVVHLPVGTIVHVPVRVLRRGYDGPILLKALDAPAGVDVKPTEIPAGKNAGTLAIVALKHGNSPLFELSLTGEATIDGQMIRRKVYRPLHLAEPYFTNLPWNWRLTRVLCCVLNQGE